MKYLKSIFLIIIGLFLFTIPNVGIGQSESKQVNTQAKFSQIEAHEHIVVKNLKSINTKGSEYSPIFHKRGLVFSCNRSVKENRLAKLFYNDNSNIFFTAMDENGDLYDAIPLPGNVNTKRHEGSVTFNAEETMMIYTSNCSKPNGVGLYELKLCSAILENGQWTKYKDLPFNDGYRTCHPSLSKDGKLLIFAANRPNGMGGMDLYASEYANGEWSTPYNLGQEINGPGDEVFPFLDDGGELYFSSNGHPGFGGLDIFRAKQNAEGQWTNLYHLQAPINTHWDDFSFIVDDKGDSGFFASNRNGGIGKDDLYAWYRSTPIELPIEEEPDLQLTQISIIDEDTGMQLHDADITLIQINPTLLETGFLDEPISIANKLSKRVGKLLGTVVHTAQTPEPIDKYPILKDMSYLLIVEKDEQRVLQQILTARQLSVAPEYAVVIPSESGTYDDIATALAYDNVEIETSMKEAEETFVVGAIAGVQDTAFHSQKNDEVFLSSEEILTARAIPEHLIKESPVKLEAVVLPVENRVVDFSPIYHAYDQYDIDDSEKVLLEHIVQELQQHPTWNLLIKSHTDPRGSAEYNLLLSQKRAETVRQQLINLGIAPKRLQTKGMGESELLYPCDEETPCKEEEWRLNRRTEFVIIR